MTDTTIKDRLNSLSPVYLDLIKSDYSYNVAASLGKKNDFDTVKINLFKNGIVLFLMLFIDFNGLVSFIQNEFGFREHKSIVLAGAVLATLPEDFIDVHKQAYEDFNSTNTKIDTSSEKVNNHIRTMTDDMKVVSGSEEIVYSSSQPTIPKK